MASPFDNNADFQQLDDETKSLIISRFSSLAPEEQSKVTTRMEELSVSPEIREQRKIVQQLESMNVGSTTIRTQQTKLKMMEDGVPNEDRPFALQDKPFQTTGENIAESIAASDPLRNTSVGPYLGALAGTTFAMLPDLAEGAIGLKGATKGVKTVKATGKAIKESGIGKAVRFTGAKQVEGLTEKAAATEVTNVSVLNKLSTARENIGKLVKSKTEEIKQATSVVTGKIKESIAKLPGHKQKILKAADDVVLQAKQSINEAEVAIGIDIKKVGTAQFKDLINTTAKVQKFAARYSKIATEAGEEVLAKSLDPQTLQTIRKAAETAAKQTTDDFMRAELFNVARTFRGAVGRSNKAITNAIGKFKDASKAVESLPASLEAKKNALKLGLKRFENMGKQKLLTDPRLKQFQRTLEILEKRTKELPRQFSNARKELELALQKARNIATQQARLRFQAGGVALAAGTAAIGRGIVRKVSGQ